MSNRIDPMNHGILGKVGEKIGDASSTTKVKTSSDVAAKEVDRKSDSVDSVELTSSAKLLERLEKTLASLPEIDRSRVEAVKTAIANGDYETDAENIADAILRMDRELGEE